MFFSPLVCLGCTKSVHTQRRVRSCARMSFSDCLGARPTAKRLSRKSHMELLRAPLDVGSGQMEKVFFHSFPVIKISPCQRKSCCCELSHMRLARGDPTQPNLTTKPELPTPVLLPKCPSLVLLAGAFKGRHQDRVSIAPFS